MKEDLINKIIESIKATKYEEAEKTIAELFALNMESTKPHLFLGIIWELKKDKPHALRHYRAALAMDGTDQVALYNLYRVGDNTKTPIRFE